MKKRIRQIIFVVASLIVLSAIYLYLKTTYRLLDREIETISLVLDAPFRQSTPTAYYLDSTESRMTFDRPVRASRSGDSVLQFTLAKPTKLRQFRVYFDPSPDLITIKAIQLNGATSLDPREFQTVFLNVKKKDTDELSFYVQGTSGYSYFGSPRFYYSSDYSLIVGSTAAALLLLSLLFVFVGKIGVLDQARSLTWQEISVFVFIVSILLPAKIFNLALIATVLLHIKDFRLSRFLANRANLFFLAIYAVFVLNFLFVSSDTDVKAIEKYTLFLVLPIYLSCIRSSRVAVFFCIAAISIGLVFSFKALIDIAVFRNTEIISFDNFTGSMHPVYYSYLIAFSIFYVELMITQRYKYIIQFILLVLLILAGSKLILLATLLLLFIFLLNRKVAYLVAPIVILVVLLFAPVRNRIGSVINPQDLSIVSENHINDPNDPRLNGLTVRLILWEESLKIGEAQVLLLGNGVGADADQTLEERLRRRGLLDHLWYNAHNQYITTLFETGLIGLIALAVLLYQVCRSAIRTQDRLLIMFLILISLAMLTESLLERVSGIALFCTIILTLMNNKLFPGTGNGHAK